MINHARTLLLNVPGATSSYTDTGEEYIPPTFVPVELPSYLATPRRILFGTAPDRYFLNFRARELMQHLHQTELAEYVYALDPRVTYWPEPEMTFFGLAPKISIDRVVGDAGRLSLVGTPRADNGRGRSLREYEIDLVSVATETCALLLAAGGRILAEDGTPIGIDGCQAISHEGDLAAQITLLGTPGSAPETTTALLAVTGNTSQLVELPRNQLKLRLTGPVLGSSWRLQTVARPAPVISTLMPILEIMGEPLFLELFGVGNPGEPYTTFKNLWFDHPNPVYRLGGLTLAMIYRTEEIRKRTNG